MSEQNPWEAAHKTLREARADAMLVLLKAGWDPKRIALALGLESSPRGIAQLWALEAPPSEAERMRVGRAKRAAK